MSTRGKKRGSCLSTLMVSHEDVLRLVTRSKRGTRDMPKNVCVGGYRLCGLKFLFLGIT